MKCDICGKNGFNAHGLRIHKAKAHGSKPKVAKLEKVETTPMRLLVEVDINASISDCWDLAALIKDKYPHVAKKIVWERESL